MDQVANYIFSCLCGSSTAPPTSPQHDQPQASRLTGTHAINEKPSTFAPSMAGKGVDIQLVHRERLESIVADVIFILRTASEPDAPLTEKLDDAVSAEGWSEWLAENVFRNLETLVQAMNEGEEKVGLVLINAYQHAVEMGKTIFATLWQQMGENPVVTDVVVAILVIGVLVILAPHVLEVLGFDKGGIRAG